MRLLICAGGTGGGVYPALATWLALNENLPYEVEVLWVGGEGGMERIHQNQRQIHLGEFRDVTFRELHRKEEHAAPAPPLAEVCLRFVSYVGRMCRHGRSCLGPQGIR